MTKARVAIAAAIALFLISAGCNSRLLRPPVTIYADAGGHQISATVGDVERRFSSVVTSFLPSQVALHPGDAVNFDVRDTGEPHSVALGKLVDTAITALGTLGATEGVRTIESLPQMRKLPTVFPKKIEDGAPRANRSAAEPCFLTSGSPPVSESGGARACSETEQPEFDGTASFYSSGFLEEGKPFRVKLSSQVRPGIYGFMCLVHRASMHGSLEIREPDVERPRVADVRKAAMDEENDVASTLEPAARRAAALEGDELLAGTGPEGQARALIASFIPDKKKIEPGDELTWNLYGMHSISFEPSRDAEEGILVVDREGARINLDAWQPTRSPRPPGEAVSFPPRSGTVEVDGGSWGGTGSFSSGVLRATPPASVSYTLRFTRPGSYRYRCLVHDRMRGRIDVVEKT